MLPVPPAFLNRSCVSWKLPSTACKAGGFTIRQPQKRRTSFKFRKKHHAYRKALGYSKIAGSMTGDSAYQKSLFAPLSKFSELSKCSENLGFQWRRETGEAPPVADQVSLFRGRLPISGYAVSADWLEPTVYPFLGYLRAKSRLAAVALRNTPAGVVPRTPFTRKGYAASVKRRSR